MASFPRVWDEEIRRKRILENVGVMINLNFIVGSFRTSQCFCMQCDADTGRKNIEETNSHAPTYCTLAMLTWKFLTRTN